MAGKRSREEEEERQNNGAGGAEEKGDVHGGRPDGEEVVADSKPEAAQAVTKEKESGDQEEENADDQQVRGFGEYLPSQIQDAEAVAAEDSTRAHDGKTVAVDGGCDPRAAKVLRTGGPLDAEETARAKTESAHHVRNVSPRSEHEDVTKGRDEQTPDPAAWSTHPGEDSGNLAFLEAPSTPAPGTQQSPAQSPAVEKRKRVGRPPKDPPPSWVEDGGILDEQEEEIFGKVDPLGEKKITKDGQLLGGREFKIKAIYSPTRHATRLYIFALDVAKVLGYRDSYLFFKCNKHIKKIWMSDEEKLYLIEQGVMAPQLKNRPVALVTAHTVFVNFGAKVIKHGRKGADDYYETQLLGTAEWGKPIEPQRLIATAAPPQRMTETPDDASAKQDGGEPPLGSIDRFVVESAVEQIGPTEPAGVLELASRPDILLSRGYVIQQRRHPPIEGQVWEEGGRPIGFWDWHTNMEQVPVSTQATGLRVVISDRGRTHVFASPGTSSALDEQLRHAELSQVFHGSIPPSPLVSNFGGWQDDDATRSLYPIQIMDRQWCGYLPLHADRFNTQPVRNSVPAANYSSVPHVAHVSDFRHQAPAVDTPMTDVTPQIQTEYTAVSPPPVPATSQTPTKGHFCGYPNRLNQPCQRVVNHEGERCLYHKDVANSVEKERLEDERKAKRSARESRQPRTQTANSELCASCGCSQTPSGLVPKGRPGSAGSGSSDVASGNNPPAAGGDGELHDVEDLEALPFDLGTTIHCSRCKRNYHPLCVNIFSPKVIANILEAGVGSELAGLDWQCNDCKVCVVCSHAGDEASLLMCDGCDRGWHMKCCKDTVKELPTGRWLCAICSQCHTCQNSKLALQHYRELFANEDSLDLAEDNPKSPGESSSEPTAPSSRSLDPPKPYPSSCFRAVQALPDLPPTTLGGNRKAPLRHTLYLTTYCFDCHGDFQAGRFCPCCLRTFGEDDGKVADEIARILRGEGGMIEGKQKLVRPRGRPKKIDAPGLSAAFIDPNMLQCARCFRWTHRRCDARTTDDAWMKGKSGVEPYRCPLCEALELKRNSAPPAPVPGAAPAATSDDIDVEGEGDRHTPLSLLRPAQHVKLTADLTAQPAVSPAFSTGANALPTVDEAKALISPELWHTLRSLMAYKSALIGVPGVPDGVKEVREAKRATRSR